MKYNISMFNNVLILGAGGGGGGGVGGGLG